jgi:hypothetical protein
MFWVYHISLQWKGKAVGIPLPHSSLYTENQLRTIQTSLIRCTTTHFPYTKWPFVSMLFSYIEFLPRWINSLYLHPRLNYLSTDFVSKYLMFTCRVTLIGSFINAYTADHVSPVLKLFWSCLLFVSHNTLTFPAKKCKTIRYSCK